MQSEDFDKSICVGCGTELPPSARSCLWCGEPRRETQEEAPIPIAAVEEDPTPVTEESPGLDLEDGYEYGPSLLTLTSSLGCGLLLLGVGLAAPLESSWWAIAAGLAFCLMGLWAAQTNLVVGQQGFRCSGVLGSTEIRWDQVSKVRARHSDWMEHNWIEVALIDGASFEFGHLGLSDSRDRVSDTMEVHQSRWRRAHPAPSTAGHSGRPYGWTRVASIPDARRPLMFGLSAIVLVAVVCLASAWRFGAFDGLTRGTLAAPTAGHWEGVNPAISFDVGAGGQMASVRLEVEDLPYAACSVWASVVPVLSDHRFAAVLGTEPSTGNLMSFEVEITGEFYGATASGTYRTLACGGILSGQNVREGKWRAAWQHP